MNNLTKPYIYIQGGRSLKGTVKVSGSKNAVLPILFSTILADGHYKIYNAPYLKDVLVAGQILESLGFSVKRESNFLSVKSCTLKNTQIQKEIAQQMRASFLCLGPLLSRYKEAKIPLPGGCKIGQRPVDMHLKALECLGAKISTDDEFVYAKAPGGLKGALVELDFPTVGGTENIIMAAVLAEGITVIKNRALEPEIEDLISCLKKMGAKIEETNNRQLKITGVKKLKAFTEHKVISDRIEAGTLLLAGAITNGEVCVQDCKPEHLQVFLEELSKSGFALDIQKDSITLKSTDIKNPAHIKTEVYPGFPTDLQSQFASLMTQLKGESFIEENIFENRFRYADKLKKFKAKIEIKNQYRIYIKGPVSLKGATVQATDLRASASLILAALVAEGESFVTDIFHLDRGYENLDLKLESLGALVKRVV